MQAAKRIDDTPAVAAAAPPPAKPKAAPQPSYVDTLTAGGVFAGAAFAFTVSVCIGMVYGGLVSLADADGLLTKLVCFVVAVASAAPLLLMWNALEPGTPGLKTIGVLVLAAVQAAATAGLLYGAVFIVRLFVPSIGFH